MFEHFSTSKWLQWLEKKRFCITSKEQVHALFLDDGIKSVWFEIILTHEGVKTWSTKKKFKSNTKNNTIMTTNKTTKSN